MRIVPQVFKNSHSEFTKAHHFKRKFIISGKEGSIPLLRPFSWLTPLLAPNQAFWIHLCIPPEFRPDLRPRMMLPVQELMELYRAEHEQEIHQARRLHEQLVSERVAARYNKHYGICQQIVDDVVDLTVNVAEYREFTNKSVLSPLVHNVCRFSSITILTEQGA